MTCTIYILTPLIESQGARTKFKKVYDEYKEWVRDNGYKQCGRKKFKEKLEGKGIKVDDYIGQDHVFEYELKNSLH